MIAKIYIIIFALIFVGFVGYYLTMVSPIKGVNAEHFTTDEDYESRLHVIKVFDGYLHRNPTMEEITKYSMHKNEQDILTSVMRDFKPENYSDLETTSIDAPSEDVEHVEIVENGEIDENIDKVDDVLVEERYEEKKNDIVPKMKSIIQDLQDIADKLQKST